MPETIYTTTWTFMIYAFLGWCLEVAYAGLNSGRFINRGFLNGPYCPIYGFGVLIVTTLLNPLKNNLLILFFGSVVITSSIEFLTGLILEKIFSKRWWDYSNVPFNLMGYICLKFSIAWGLGCMFVVEYIYPIVLKLIDWFPQYSGSLLLAISVCWMTIDLAATIDLAWDEKNNLRILEKSAEGMRKISDEIGEGVYKTTVTVFEKVEDVKGFAKKEHEKHKKD